MMRPLRHLWRIQNSTYEITRGYINAIIIPSYGMCKDRLPKISNENIRLGIWWQTNYFPHASLIVSTCSYTDEAHEYYLKQELFAHLGFPTQKIIWIRNIDSTMDEGDKIKTRISCSIKDVLGITGDAHSRSFYTLYTKLFPHAKIFIDCIPFDLEFQSDHLIQDQTSGYRWAKSNFIRECIFQIPVIGFWIARHAPHHKIKS